MGFQGFIRHPLVHTLINLRGNARACVYTEPLWGIPYTLYTPFVSVYMYALGLSDVQIGAVLSISLVSQVFCSLLSGIITDKLGRRLGTLLFDFVGWSLACLIWALAQNYWWFVAAAVFNGAMQITTTSWNCLLVEDAEKNDLVNIYTWVHISGLVSVFAAPVAGLLVGEYTLVPVMRGLYMFSLVSMSVKFILLYIYSVETDRGKQRLSETKDVSVFSMLVGYGSVFKLILGSPQMIMTLLVMVGINITANLTASFYPLLISNDLGMPEQYLAYFPIIRSTVILLILFFVQRLLSLLSFKSSMVSGLVIYIVSQLMLIAASGGGLGVIILYFVCEAVAFALVMPRRDSMVAENVDPAERARVLSIMYVIMLSVTAPFGYLGGFLSSIDRRLPFAMNALLYVGVALLISLSTKAFGKKIAD